MFGLVGTGSPLNRRFIASAHRLAAVTRLLGVAGALWITSASQAQDIPAIESTAEAIHANDANANDVLVRAGANRAEIERARQRVPADQQRGLDFLLQNMPLRDLTTLTADYLLENTDYAYRAWRQSAWHDHVSEDLFFNDILPYANINERRDAWRKDFYERCLPLIGDAKSPGQAAARLNQQWFNCVKVHYSTRRPKADQSPYESIDAGMASCTGLSILLIDACRAVGVPARFVGIPMWTDNSGNHSWVEVWDNGWHFTGADEATGEQLDQAWFVDRAGQARTDSPRNAIYAVSFRRTPLPFPLVWKRGQHDVSAVNVTDRYLNRGRELSADQVAVMFRVISPTSRDRCAANFRIRDQHGNIVFQGQTKDERFDANDHLTVPLTKDQTYQVELIQGDQVQVRELRTAAQQELVTLTAASDTPPTPHDASPGDVTPTSAPTAVAAGDRVIDELKRYLETESSQRVPLQTLAFAHQPLSRDAAQTATELLWQDYSRQLKQARTAEFTARALTIGDKTMRFAYTVFGDAPPTGRSLYLSLHGGGNAPASVNDRQWENQQRLYEPREGVYLSPRAPTNTWNLWHEPHIDDFFDRLISDLTLFENVDPNRVYLLGYSAGGDGVYQVAPRFADRLAAAAMMAGHPNEASPLGLRNLPFTLHVGGNDSSYHRNDICRAWGQQLDDLQRADPTGYVHTTHVHEGKGHWMDREDAVAIEWLAGFTRNPFPRRIVWYQDDVVHRRFYWLALAERVPAAGWTIRADVTGQTITLTTTLPAGTRPELSVRLHDQLVDLDQPVTIVVNDATVYTGPCVRTLTTLTQTMMERNDSASIYPAEITVTVP